MPKNPQTALMVLPYLTFAGFCHIPLLFPALSLIITSSCFLSVFISDV